MPNFFVDVVAMVLAVLESLCASAYIFGNLAQGTSSSMGIFISCLLIANGIIVFLLITGE
jgi:hypothetical protein